MASTSNKSEDVCCSRSNEKLKPIEKMNNEKENLSSVFEVLASYLKEGETREKSSLISSLCDLALLEEQTTGQDPKLLIDEFKTGRKHVVTNSKTAKTLILDLLYKRKPNFISIKFDGTNDIGLEELKMLLRLLHSSTDVQLQCFDSFRGETDEETDYKRLQVCLDCKNCNLVSFFGRFTFSMLEVLPPKLKCLGLIFHTTQEINEFISSGKTADVIDINVSFDWDVSTLKMLQGGVKYCFIVRNLVEEDLGKMKDILTKITPTCGSPETQSLSLVDCRLPSNSGGLLRENLPNLNEVSWSVRMHATQEWDPEIRKNFKADFSKEEYTMPDYCSIRSFYYWSPTY